MRHERVTKLFVVTTADANPVNVAMLTLPGNGSVIANVHAIAYGITSNQADDYQRTQSYGVLAGVLREIGVTQNDYTKEEDGGWNFDLNLTGNYATAVLTGDAAENVVWHIVAEFTVHRHS